MMTTDPRPDMGCLQSSPAVLMAALGNPSPNVPPLTHVQVPTVSTEHAAIYLNRQPQTLRKWATYGSGPLQPRRIGGRLAWSVADLRRLLGVE
jgi:hypothetical protein